MSAFFRNISFLYSLNKCIVKIKALKNQYFNNLFQVSGKGGYKTMNYNSIIDR